MDDDVSLLADHADSLWFYSNVLSMSPPPTSTTTNDSERREVKETNRETTSTTTSTGSGSETRNDTTMRRRRRSIGGGRGRRRRRRVLGELDLCWYEESCGYCERLWCLYDYYENMPPLSDDVAMKEHIRSWACAVACVVR